MQPSFASVSRCCQDVLAFAEELVAEFWLAVSEARKAGTETAAGRCCVARFFYVCMFILWYVLKYLTILRKTDLSLETHNQPPAPEKVLKVETGKTGVGWGGGG